MRLKKTDFSAFHVTKYFNKTQSMPIKVTLAEYKKPSTKRIRVSAAEQGGYYMR
jgi:hypothetical protein